MKVILCGLLLFLLLSCQPTNPSVPRPHQYPKIEYPEKKYSSFSPEACPFQMELPSYTTIVKKDLLFDEIEANPCWFDINMPIFDAAVHCSYYPIGKEHSLDKLINDAFTMASKHNVKATFREEFVIKNQYGGGGLIFKINGPVATPYQFYLTDSTNHFLRGSLYFNSHINIDSLAPVASYIQDDIDQIINSIRWN